MAERLGVKNANPGLLIQSVIRKDNIPRSVFLDDLRVVGIVWTSWGAVSWSSHRRQFETSTSSYRV
jgi:hypothetical protein